MPEISIIIPIYNVEKYLPACVSSIFAQTFSDYELILVDDGSTDCCSSLCEHYAQTDSRVIVIHQEHYGPSAARNRGIDIARGNYLCFIDSDDLIHPEYCETLFHLLKYTSFDFSFCNTLRFPDGSTPISADSFEPPFVISNTDYLQMQMDRKTEFGVWNKLYRRECFDSLRFVPGKLNEDVIFSADLFAHLNNSAIGTNRQLYYYRRRPGSIVSIQATKGSPDRIWAGNHLLQAVKEKAPELYSKTLHYAIEYPWSFIDPIYVKFTFGSNKLFLQEMHNFLKSYIRDYISNDVFSDIQRNRMALFAKSPCLYSFNAYSRLLRVYLYHLLKKDAYSDGHGI